MQRGNDRLRVVGAAFRTTTPTPATSPAPSKLVPGDARLLPPHLLRAGGREGS